MYKVTRFNKYGNTKQEYGDHRYDSKLESEYALELDIRKKAGEIKGWRRQERIECRVNGHLITTYKMDFIIEENDGSETWVECKGMETYDWKLRWKLICALYPETEKIIVKRSGRFRAKSSGRRERYEG